MRTFAIESVEEWEKLASKLRERGYSPYSYQFSANDKEGFHTWFMKPGKEDVEIITHSPEIQKAIIGFNSLKDRL